MKRLVKIITVTMLIVFFVSGCTYTPNNASTSTPQETPTPTPANAKIGLVLSVGGTDNDNFNDLVCEGAQRAINNLNVIVDILKPETIGDYDTMIGQLAEDGTYDLIIAVTPDAKNAVKKYAKLYPQQKFTITDTAIYSYSNIRCVNKSYSEMTFLGGSLAALVTQTEDESETVATEPVIIGMVVGEDTTLTEEAIAGFKAGAKMINSDIEVKVTFIDSWTDTEKSKAAAKALYKAGAQVIMCFAGEASSGVIAAAQEYDKLAIGVSANQNAEAPDNVIASCTEVIDLRIYSEIERIIADTWTAGVDEGGLREGAVDIVYDDSNVSVSKTIKNEIEEIRHNIVTNKLKVPSDADKIETWLIKVK